MSTEISTEDSDKKPENIKEEIQSSWQLPAVAQFVSLFHEDLKLPEIEIEELEDGLLQISELGCKTVQNLLIGLLQGISKNKINENNYEVHLEQTVRKIWRSEGHGSAPLDKSTKFTNVDFSTKLSIFHALCCLRLEQVDAQDLLKKMDADTLRVQPLGSDDEGNEYWYFYGTRLYKQEPDSKSKNKSWEEEWDAQKSKAFVKRGPGRPRRVRKSDGESDESEESVKNNRFHIKDKSRWSVVCNTMEDWVDFAEKFKNSKSKTEQSLFQVVAYNFLPALNDVYLEKERKLQKKLRELIPARRMSTRTDTRRLRIKSRPCNLSKDAIAATHKQYLARERTQRLEERNRRATEESGESLRKRRRVVSYADQEDEDETVVEDNSAEEEDTASDPEPLQFVPLASISIQDVKAQLMNVLDEVKLREEAWPFLQPVDEAYAPAYNDIIKVPMDLSIISEKLQEDNYQTLRELDADFKLMVENCSLYNGENHKMTKMVSRLWKMFRKTMETVAAPPDTGKRTERPQRRAARDQVADSSAGAKSVEKPQEKRKRKKAAHLEVLEIMSKEAELALERSQSNDAEHFKQVSPSSKEFSNLKIASINDHPAELIEKFSSDSSNAEANAKSSSSSLPDQDTDFLAFGSAVQADRASQPPRESSPPPHPTEEAAGNSEFPEIGDSNDPKSLPEQNSENSPRDDPRENQSEYRENAMPTVLERSNRPSNSPDEYRFNCESRQNPSENQDSILCNGLYRPSHEEYKSNPSVSSIVSSLLGDNRTCADTQQIPVMRHRNDTPPQGASPPQPSDKDTSFVSDNFCLQELNRLASGDFSTIDTSALSFSSNCTFTKKQVNLEAPMGTVPFPIQSRPTVFQPPQVSFESSRINRLSPEFSRPRYSPTSSALHLAANAFLPPSMQTRSSPDVVELPQLSSAAPLPPVSSFVPAGVAPQVPYSRAFPDQGNLATRPPDGKFPSMKVSLPPSSGEILVVPGEPASSSLTFHLFAQPNAAAQPPIQTSVEVKASESRNEVQIVHPMRHEVSVLSENSTVQSSFALKRNSPVQVLQSSSPVGSMGSSPRSDASDFRSKSFSDSGSSPSSASSCRPKASKRRIASSVAAMLNGSSSFAPNPHMNGSVHADLSSYQTLCPKTVPMLFRSFNPQPPQGMCQNSTVMTNSVSLRMASGAPPAPFVNGQVPRTVLLNAVGDVPRGLMRPSVGTTTASVFPGSNNSMLQSFSFPNVTSMNNSPVFTQVQMPQYVGNPYYIVADPNSMQNQARYPVMNMQPVPFPSR